MTQIPGLCTAGGTCLLCGEQARVESVEVTASSGTFPALAVSCRRCEWGRLVPTPEAPR